MTDWETRYYEAEASHTEANGMLTAENERLKRLHTDAFHEAQRWKERYEEETLRHQSGRNVPFDPPEAALEAICGWMEWPWPSHRQDAMDLYVTIVAAVPDFAHQVCAVPEGWKLVPVVLSEAMLEAAAVLRNEAEGVRKPLRTSALWLALLDAAPDYEFVACNQQESQP